MEFGLGAGEGMVSGGGGLAVAWPYPPCWSLPNRDAANIQPPDPYSSRWTLKAYSNWWSKISIASATRTRISLEGKILTDTRLKTGRKRAEFSVPRQGGKEMAGLSG